jgi:hypothetical protein
MGLAATEEQMAGATLRMPSCPDKRSTTLLCTQEEPKKKLTSSPALLGGDGMKQGGILPGGSNIEHWNEDCTVNYPPNYGTTPSEVDPRWAAFKDSKVRVKSKLY